MEESRYSGFSESPRKRCCGRETQLALMGLVTAALWAGLLTLLLLWHWDTLRDMKQLEEAAARNVSQVSKDLQRYQGDQMAQKSQASEMWQMLQELRSNQKTRTQDSGLSWDLDRLREDLSNFKSQSLNERRTASDLLERLQEEVAKLWMEILVSNGSSCNTCPENWVHFQRKCYYFGEGSKQWIHARYACDNLQGRLVSIHSQEEQDFLSKHVSKRGSWIGLRDLDIEGEFIWVDGSRMDYRSIPAHPARHLPPTPEGLGSSPRSAPDSGSLPMRTWEAAVTAPVLGSLPATRETRREFWASDFSLTRPWLLGTFRK
ncbi:low affinity immunoglobulin epsilon Fc receptor isoform X1 [Oryctolagus cuniculus]|uniref:low affinity immunoglobulin epsilon Fc receptor isoform X1 n=1 Tax=Oryctolagus cuniculus TaxID=9986 RepID=UPI0038779DA6